MPNDSLDEIEARWRDGEDDPAYGEMVRAVVEALEDAVNWWESVKMMGESAGRPVSFAKDYTPSWFKAALDALDTPPAQEQKR